MSFVKGNLEIFPVSETKIDESFPKAQFLCEGYSPPYRRDRCLGGGGLLMYVNEDIPSRILTPHVIRDDIEILCVEINLRKQKWLIMGIYGPPGMKAVYFINNICRGIDVYNNRYEHFVIMGDFSLEPTEEITEKLCVSYNLYNLVKEPTCFKGPPKCFNDLILTNKKYNFQNTITITTGFPDFHKLTMTVLKTEFVKAEPTCINCSD